MRQSWFAWRQGQFVSGSLRSTAVKQTKEPCALSGLKWAMWHIKLLLPRESFESLVEVLADADCSQVWPALRTVIVEGITGARDLGDASTSVVGQVLGDVPITDSSLTGALVHSSSAPRPTIDLCSWTSRALPQSRRRYLLINLIRAVMKAARYRSAAQC